MNEPSSDPFVCLSYRLRIVLILCLQDCKKSLSTLQSPGGVSYLSTMAEFLIKDEDLISIKGKVVIVTGTAISPLRGVFVIMFDSG
jgi:hypothetical protein